MAVNEITLRSARILGLFGAVLSIAWSGLGQDTDAPSLSVEDLLEIGQQLWEENAPPEWQEEYRLPTVEEVEAFLGDFERAMAEGDVARLAAYAPEAKVALGVLRQFEGGESLANWLEPRIDYLVAAQQIEAEQTESPPEDPSKGSPSSGPKSVPAQYTQAYWTDVMAKRELPSRANRYLPLFKKAFESKGVPPELAWLSEVESSVNLTARSPAGAYGPFQFMPATAQRFNLRVGSPDDRSNPRKSAEAAASYLSILYRQFQSWPLAIAAYNAGEGRVGKAMQAAGSELFEAVAERLPAETRMYVPKVLATVSVREGIDAGDLPAAKQ